MTKIKKAEDFVKRVGAEIDAVEKEVSEAIRAGNFDYASHLIDALELAVILQQDPEPKHTT